MTLRNESRFGIDRRITLNQVNLLHRLIIIFHKIHKDYIMYMAKKGTQVYERILAVIKFTHGAPIDKRIRSTGIDRLVHEACSASIWYAITIKFYRFRCWNDTRNNINYSDALASRQSRIGNDRAYLLCRLLSQKVARNWTVTLTFRQVDDVPHYRYP